MSIEDSIEQKGQLFVVYSADGTMEGQFKGVFEKAKGNITVSSLPNFLKENSILELSQGNFKEQFSVLGSEPYGNLGHGIAIQSAKSQSKEANNMAHTVQGNIFNGDVKLVFGDDSSMNIRIEQIHAAIDKTHLSADQKEEAKSLLKKLSENPFFAASMSQVVSIIGKSLGIM